MMRQWPDYLFGVSALGAGRMTEFSLAIICAMWGTVLLCAPAEALHSADLADLAWAGFGRLVAVPFLIKATLSWVGLRRNIKNEPYSRQLRFAGASVGCFIWSWIATNLGASGAWGNGMLYVGIWCAYLSIRIMALSCANLPIPGAPGRQ